jgi:hypothetical protein
MRASSASHRSACTWHTGQPRCWPAQTLGRVSWRPPNGTSRTRDPHASGRGSVQLRVFGHSRLDGHRGSKRCHGRVTRTGAYASPAWSHPDVRPESGDEEDAAGRRNVAATVRPVVTAAIASVAKRSRRQRGSGPSLGRQSASPPRPPFGDQSSRQRDWSSARALRLKRLYRHDGCFA